VFYHIFVTTTGRRHTRKLNELNRRSPKPQRLTRHPNRRAGMKECNEQLAVVGLSEVKSEVEGYNDECRWCWEGGCDDRRPLDVECERRGIYVSGKEWRRRRTDRW